jgi:hypothetical protein
MLCLSKKDPNTSKIDHGRTVARRTSDKAAAPHHRDEKVIGFFLLRL